MRRTAAADYPSERWLALEPRAQRGGEHSLQQAGDESLRLVDRHAVAAGREHVLDLGVGLDAVGADLESARVRPPDQRLRQLAGVHAHHREARVRRLVDPLRAGRFEQPAERNRRRAAPRPVELGAGERGQHHAPLQPGRRDQLDDTRWCRLQIVLELDVVAELRAEGLEHRAQGREARSRPAAALPGMGAVEPAADVGVQQLLRGVVSHAAAQGRLGVERAVVEEHGHAVAGELHVELDLDHADRERAFEGGQRVLGRFGRDAAMRDHVKGSCHLRAGLCRRAARRQQPAGEQQRPSARRAARSTRQVQVRVRGIAGHLAHQAGREPLGDRKRRLRAGELDLRRHQVAALEDVDLPGAARRRGSGCAASRSGSPWSAARAARTSRG